jgi:hypothetical protein
LEEKMMMKKGKFLNLPSLKHAELEKMKKGENGWLLQQEEDGESQNTFSWTGWMTRWMDGRKKLHDRNILYYM